MQEFLVKLWFHLLFQDQHFLLVTNSLFICPCQKIFYVYHVFLSIMFYVALLSYFTAFRLFLLISLFYSYEFFFCLQSSLNQKQLNHHSFDLFQHPHDLQKVQSFIFGLLAQNIWIFSYQLGISYYFYCIFFWEYLQNCQLYLQHLISLLTVNNFCLYVFFGLFQPFLRFFIVLLQKLYIIVVLVIDILSFFTDFEFSYQQQFFLQSSQHPCSFYETLFYLSCQLDDLIFPQDLNLFICCLSTLLFQSIAFLGRVINNYSCSWRWQQQCISKRRG